MYETGGKANLCRSRRYFWFRAKQRIRQSAPWNTPSSWKVLPMSSTLSVTAIETNPDGFDILSYVPADMRFEVFTYLTPVSITCCMRVCKAWYESASEQLLWYTMFLSTFPLLNAPNTSWEKDWRTGKLDCPFIETIVYGAMSVLEGNWKATVYKKRKYAGGTCVTYLPTNQRYNASPPFWWSALVKT